MYEFVYIDFYDLIKNNCKNIFVISYNDKDVLQKYYLEILLCEKHLECCDMYIKDIPKEKMDELRWTLPIVIYNGDNIVNDIEFTYDGYKYVKSLSEYERYGNVIIIKK